MRSNQFDNWVRSLTRYVIGRVEALTRDVLPLFKRSCRACKLMRYERA